MKIYNRFDNNFIIRPITVIMYYHTFVFNISLCFYYIHYFWGSLKKSSVKENRFHSYEGKNPNLVLLGSFHCMKLQCSMGSK